MIGFPSFSGSYTFEELSADIGGSIQLVDTYDSSAGPCYLQKTLGKDWSTTYLSTGYAYMIRVSSDVDWLVPGD